MLTAPVCPRQSIVNLKPDPSEETEEQKEQKHKTFVEKYEKEIKHFGKCHLKNIHSTHIIYGWIFGATVASYSSFLTVQACCGVGTTARSTSLTTLI